jgi:hypothetical protein
MMNKATAQELKLLREIAHYFLDGETCHFCGQPLIEDLDKTFGDKANRPIRARLTVHHVDEGHPNNQRDNTVWCHRPSFLPCPAHPALSACRRGQRKRSQS